MFRRRSPRQSLAPHSNGEYLCSTRGDDAEKSGRGLIVSTSLCLALLFSVGIWSNGLVGADSSIPSLRASSPAISEPTTAGRPSEIPVTDSNDDSGGSNHTHAKKPKRKKKQLTLNLNHLSYGDLWDVYNCDEQFSSTQPARSTSSWMFMRGIYHGLMVDSTAKDIAPRPSSLLQDTGMAVPYSIRKAGEKGRGIFAEDTIPKGSMVYTARHGGHVRFRHGMDFKTFVVSVPGAMACEILQCAAVQSLSEEQPTRPETSVITVDLDDTCYVNSADNDDDENDDENDEEGDKKDANVGCPKGNDFNCIDNGYALRDIEAGEEILCDYETFAILEGWEWFSL